ncbi:MAG: alpha/beta hydrolase [Clostridia bacterium]|nr:alpha/beta hydrolase [Clostridia bacterium]
MQPYLIAVIAVLAVLVLLFLFALVGDRAAFGKRADKNPYLKYFTAEDFDLSAESVALSHGLKGYFYRGKTQNNKLVIFCHGMGPGHIAYTTEIAYFCNLGYTVLAVDNKGCNLSAGRNIGGMYSGVKTAVKAIDFAKKYSFEKVFLVGHSWGGYSALCASKQRKVDGVIAISAPTTPAKTIAGGASPYLTKPVSVILIPFWWIINLLKFGVYGNANSAKCAMKNSTPTFLIHGDKDEVVSPSRAAFYKAEGDNISKLSVKERAHNPYNTVKAEKYLAELLRQLRLGETVFDEFDFAAATEEDEEVMNWIEDFLYNN